MVFNFFNYKIQKHLVIVKMLLLPNITNLHINLNTFLDETFLCEFKKVAFFKLHFSPLDGIKFGIVKSYLNLF